MEAVQDSFMHVQKNALRNPSNPENGQKPLKIHPPWESLRCVGPFVMPVGSLVCLSILRLSSIQISNCCATRFDAISKSMAEWSDGLTVTEGKWWPNSDWSQVSVISYRKSRWKMILSSIGLYWSLLNSCPRRCLPLYWCLTHGMRGLPIGPCKNVSSLVWCSASHDSVASRAARIMEHKCASLFCICMFFDCFFTVFEFMTPSGLLFPVSSYISLS